MDQHAVKAFCARLPHATAEHPFGPDPLVFKVGGKMFALLSLDEPPGHVSLKCEPGFAEVLRERYPAVSGGYHLNKRHWNTVRLDGSVPAAELRDWIEESYALVLNALPRGERARLGA